jgi:hypothetical protein
MAMKATALAFAAAAVPALSAAQSLEPRAYSNSPVGLNFAIAAYSYSTGGIAFDPSIPLENGDGRVDALSLVYVRTLDVLGNAGSVGVLLPLAHFSGSATAPNGVEESRAMSGAGDPALRLAVNFHGAPALTAAQFAGYRQDLIVGASLILTAPLGQYDSTHVVNLGTNRWSAKPEIGLSQAVGPWTFELNAAGTWFTKNDDFFGGNTREQEPIYSTQLHVTRQFGRGTWGAVSATYYAGGQTSLNGVARDDRQSGSRFGATFALPLGAGHSLKLFASTGLYTRTGEDFNTVGVAWQTVWGGR